MQVLKRPLPFHYHNHQFSSTPTPPPSPSSIATLVLTTTNPTHLTQTLLNPTQWSWSTTLVNQTLKHLWNHGPKALLFFTILDRHPTYSHSLSSYHLAVDISARLRRFSDVWTLLDRLRHRRLGPTPLTFSIILERYVSAGKPDKALDLFLTMHKHFANPFSQDLNSFNNMLDILCKAKRVQKAVDLMRVFKGRFKPDVITYNIIANGWCQIRRVNKALAVFKEMLHRGIDPNLSTYNVILKGYFRAGMVNQAWEFFKEMKRRKCEVDVVTYTSLIHGFGVAGEVARSRTLFSEMLDRGVLPNVATYNAFIQVLCKKDSVENAIQVYEDMMRKGYVPNGITYNLLIRGLCHHGEMGKAEELVGIMRKDGCDPNVQTFNLLIRYYCEAGEIDKGLELFGKMGLEECLPNLDTYNVLISSMFVRKKSEDLMVAGRLLVEMVERGFLPTRFNFNRVLNGLLVTGNQDFARQILRLQSKCGLLPKHFSYSFLSILKENPVMIYMKGTLRLLIERKWRLLLRGFWTPVAVPSWISSLVTGVFKRWWLDFYDCAGESNVGVAVVVRDITSDAGLQDGDRLIE
ncbi:hypothetical protein KSS87_010354 [Heliosperma pusillum]|nr:hypothetical protein KSS87_010354 [Heliosperma pusillum]